MANVSLRHVYKIYDGGVTAVTDFNLEIADKEFIILVGPSGCGKSTTLRMIEVLRIFQRVSFTSAIHSQTMLLLRTEISQWYSRTMLFILI